MDDTEALFTQTFWGDPVDEPFDPEQVPLGRFSIAVLDQTKVWIGETTGPRLLATMSRKWRRNVAAYLSARAPELHRFEAMYEVTGAGASAAAYISLLLSGAPLIGDIDAYTWMESTPLFRALRALDPGLASPAVLRAWAEATHRSWREDRSAKIWLPQDPDRLWVWDS
ncbi:MAG TPA: hypothetical protein VK662_00645 [Acidothermaceae bacterium]|nr:hypothetical protein [Acidothermaceae bacterium]